MKKAPTVSFLEEEHMYTFGLPLSPTNALRNLPTFFALDFQQLLDAPGKRLKYDINVQQGFKKLLNSLLDSSFVGGYHRIHFRFLQYEIVFEIE